MTIAQFIVAYAVCWWLVLFMVLPAGAEATPTPEKGHAPSAPAKPRLKMKFRWATVLAFLPTLFIYFVAVTVKAEDGIYRVGGGCNRLSTHKPAADIHARDGYGTGDKRVKPVDVNGKNHLVNTDSIRIPLEIPSQNYIDRAAQSAGGNANGPTSINGRNVDLSQSFVRAGELEVRQDGDVLLNGQPITDNQAFEEGCVDEK